MQPLTANLVLKLTGRESQDVKVVGLSYDGDIGVATVVTDDDREDLIDATEFRWTEPDGWRIGELGLRRDFTAAVGRFPNRDGEPLRVMVQDRTLTVPVSPGGWYGVVAILDDNRDPDRRVRFLDYE